MILLLILSMLQSNEIELPLIMEYQDNGQDEEPLIYDPVDAVFDGERLWVADINYRLVIIPKEGKPIVHGREGSGPKEFQQTLTRVNFIDEQVMISVFNDHERHWFSPAGTFIKKERHNKASYERSEYFRNNQVFKRAEKDVLFHKNKNCYYGEPIELHDKETHLEAFFPVAGDKHIYLIKKYGLIQVYNNCTKLKQFTVNVEAYKADVKESAKVTKVSNILMGKKGKFYRYGIPIIAGAADGDRHLWLLLQEEKTLKKTDYWPTQTYLIQMDTSTGTELNRYHVGNTDSIRIKNGYLTLASRTEGEVQVYKLSSN